MSASGEWILKIISGPHQGAEVPLRAGRIVLGAHPECDLVLHDVLVAPQHVALTLADDTLTVEPIEGAVFVNGKRAAAASPVPPFGFVTIGTTHVVAGPATARWPLLSLADVPAVEKEQPATAAAPEPSAETAESNDPAKKKNQPSAPSPTQRRRALWSAGFGGVLLLVWVVLWWMWTSRASFAPPPGVRDRAEQVLRGFPDARTIRLEPQGDHLVATGYVGSDSTHREITAAFRAKAPEVTLRIWSMPRLLETARSFLSERNLNLELAAGEDGTLHVHGTVRSQDEWLRARRLLLSEVPGIQQLREDVTVAAPAAPAARPVVVAAAPPTVWSDVSVVALQELADGHGWLRLSNGAVLFRGARLADGSSITSFRHGCAIVEKEQARFTLAVGADLATALQGPPQPAAADDTDTALSSAVPVAATTLPRTGEKTAQSSHSD
jgi:type III secretion system YscD/HrpQ family protein